MFSGYIMSKVEFTNVLREIAVSYVLLDQLDSTAGLNEACKNRSHDSLCIIRNLLAMKKKRDSHLVGRILKRWRKTASARMYTPFYGLNMPGYTHDIDNLNGSRAPHIPISGHMPHAQNIAPSDVMAQI